MQQRFLMRLNCRIAKMERCAAIDECGWGIPCSLTHDKFCRFLGLGRSISGHFDELICEIGLAAKSFRV